MVSSCLTYKYTISLKTYFLKTNALAYLPFAMSVSNEVKGFETKTNEFNVKRLFFDLSMLRKPNKLERPSKPSLIFVSKAEVCPRGVPFRCSLLEQAFGLAQLFGMAGKARQEQNALAYLASISDGEKCCITPTPGPNGIELFTLVI